MARWGMTFPFPGVPLSDHRDWLRQLVDLGYSDLWTAEVAGADAFTPLAAAAGWVPEMRLGTGIASIFSRGPALLAMEAAALAELAPGRFVLGIGSSSPLIVEGWNDGSYRQPYRRTRDTLRFLRRALAGERVDEEFESFAVRGFALERAPAIVPPIFVAALREKMLALAGQEADGVLLGLVTPDDVRRSVAALGPGGEGREVALRIGVILTADVASARERARRIAAAYLNVPAYAALHRWLGREEQLAPLWKAWRAGDRRAALAAVPDELVDALFVYGSPGECRARIEEFREAGVTTPLLSLMSLETDLGSALISLSPGAGP